MSAKIHISSHRGIDLDDRDSPPESTRSSFEKRLREGYGIEFDLVELSDGEFVISHDLEVKQRDGTKISLPQLNRAQIEQSNFEGEPFLGISECLELLQSHGSQLWHCLHLKARNQAPKAIEKFSAILQEFSSLLSHTIIFDLLPETAKSLRSQFPSAQLAYSLSLPSDISRFGKLTGNTLFPLETCISQSQICNWSWLDEWDRKDEANEKNIHDPQNYSTLRTAGIKIALVTPELHRSSPAAGFSAHEDASEPALSKRLKEIIALKPDLICTDYPSKCRGLIEN